MKKIVIITLTLINFILVSCSSSSPEKPNFITKEVFVSKNLTEEKSIQSQKIVETSIQKSKEIYSCDFSNSSCDFNIAVGTTGTLISQNDSYLSINNKGITGSYGEFVSIDKEINITFNKVEVVFSDLKKSVGYGDSLFGLSSKKQGWYNFIVYCETELSCELITYFVPTNRFKDKFITKINPPTGEFKLTITIKEENENYHGYVYFNDKLMYKLTYLFDGNYKPKDTLWMIFNFRNNENTSNKFRVKKIMLYE